MRSTRTWSPMSSVFSMEAEGISKFWKMKVMMKRPRARTVQMEASDSSGVSCSCCSGSVVGVSFSSGVVAGMSVKIGSPLSAWGAGLVYRAGGLGWSRRDGDAALRSCGGGREDGDRSTRGGQLQIERVGGAHGLLDFDEMFCVHAAIGRVLPERDLPRALAQEAER